ncbi:DUF5667 domain-containing protein [Candidatus Hakubella thermalkaliphila]|nr:DUF5667 domain-containing protein [Candidatus Hakubella thermalkaliphila]
MAKDSSHYAAAGVRKSQDYNVCDKIGLSKIVKLHRIVETLRFCKKAKIMLKKLLIVSVFSLLLFAGGAYAQTDTLPDPGMLPDSPFYFLKSWAEDVGTLFTFGDVAKCERLVNLAEKRLGEAKALLEKGKPEVAEKALARYQEQLNSALSKAQEAKGKGLDTDEVLTKVSEATLKHQAVLADVYERVPEQAKPAIQRAIEAGMRGYEEALKAISGQKREEILKKTEDKRRDVEKRLEDLRKKGVPIPTIPVPEKIEQPIPTPPGTQKLTTPGRPQTQEQEREVEESEPETERLQSQPGRGGAETPQMPRSRRPGR